MMSVSDDSDLVLTVGVDNGCMYSRFYVKLPLLYIVLCELITYFVMYLSCWGQ